jgi:hypothetical protein
MIARVIEKASYQAGMCLENIINMKSCITLDVRHQFQIHGKEDSPLVMSDLSADQE